MGGAGPAPVRPTNFRKNRISSPWTRYRGRWPRARADRLRREIVVNATAREKRVAILEDRQLVELMYERPDERRIVGDIYLGVVEAIVPGLQAAFVDIGTGKSGFLHASDLEPDEDEDEDGARGNGGRNGRNRDRSHPPIQDVLSKGQSLLVQVTKEPIGTKGPRVTSQISLAGRFLVYLPGSSHIGVSRKIGDREVRGRLRAMVREVLGDKGGVIVRTIGEEMSREACANELRTLRKSWTKIRRKRRGVKAPALVYQDARLTSGVMRDLFSDRIDLLTVDSKELHHEIKSYLGQVDPGLLDRVRLYDAPKPIFDEFGIEEEIRRAFRRSVRLPSGGQIVIEQTEALVSIDVNTGRYTGRRDPAKTILKTNIEAAAEIARQLRLRDVGGIIVIDFIDMNDEESRDHVVQRMRTLLGSGPRPHEGVRPLRTRSPAAEPAAGEPQSAPALDGNPARAARGRGGFWPRRRWCAASSGRWTGWPRPGASGGSRCSPTPPSPCTCWSASASFSTESGPASASRSICATTRCSVSTSSVSSPTRPSPTSRGSTPPARSPRQSLTLPGWADRLVGPAFFDFP